MFSKGLAGVNSEKYVVCTMCKRKGHSADKCWTIVGYPKWYNKPADRGNSAARWNDRGEGRSGNAPCTNSVNCVGSDKRESPNQNARVERKHKHVLKVARSLKFQSNLPPSYWGDCVLTAAHIINRTPSSMLNHVSPYEVLYKEPPDYDGLIAFGCLAIASPPGVVSDKFQPRAVMCIFVGYPAGKKGFKLLVLNSMTPFVSRDVKFYEHIFPLHNSIPSTFLNPVPSETLPNTPTFEFDEFTQLLNDEHQKSSQETQSLVNNTEPSDEPTDQDQNTSSAPILLRRSLRQTKPPVWMDAYITKPSSSSTALCATVATQEVQPTFQCFVTSIVKTEDPKTFYQAIEQQH
ncbi:uncharacterized protein LOC141689887 [Apium graveolens]|uniref:uncharacterized protein LOC141689887 n=1 Tax=Apium graveolens TaxID=4045 RepID=UPI003D7AD862